MKTITKTLYEFNDLSEDAKEKAREWYREGALDYEWYDTVYEDAKTIGKLMGIDIDNIYFSGFWSQGDGACFEGSYEYVKGSVKAVKEHAPLDTELHQIAESLRDIQRREFYRVNATVKHSGHYEHKYCTRINVYDYAIPDTEEAIAELLRDFMDWIYHQLETEYEYLVSDEVVEDTILANEYTFNERGNREY